MGSRKYCYEINEAAWNWDLKISRMIQKDFGPALPTLTRRCIILSMRMGETCAGSRREPRAGLYPNLFSISLRCSVSDLHSLIIYLFHNQGELDPPPVAGRLNHALDLRAIDENYTEINFSMVCGVSATFALPFSTEERETERKGERRGWDDHQIWVPPPKKQNVTITVSGFLGGYMLSRSLSPSRLHFDVYGYS